MNNSKKFSLNGVYNIFLISVILISLIFIIYIMFMESILDVSIIYRGKIIIASIIFTIIILITSMIFLSILKKKVSNSYISLENMINDAINKEEISVEYDETILSSLENKMLKYIKMTKSSKKSIENERNKVKTLVSDISHQTKTPIANILLFSQLALENKDIDTFTNEYLLEIKKQSERLDFLIQSLIKMSRLENGIISLNKNKAKLNETISKSVQKVFINAQKKKIDIKLDCDENIEAIYDSKWTEEALVNILENAIKYTNKNGKIDIEVIIYELFIRVDIKDNGIGIEESEINNIFKRFYRSKNVNQYDGVGIGLYLAREIIALQGGYIKVLSEIGKGSTFSVFLLSQL